MQNNPYAPPLAAEAPLSGGLVFSSEGIETVGAMAKWMRFLGVVYFLGAGLMALAAFGVMFAGGAVGMAIGAGFAIAVVFMVITAMWLREAADQFVAGVATDEPLTLGAGFRTLRKYLIVFGVLEAINLAGALFSMFAGGVA